MKSKILKKCLAVLMLLALCIGLVPANALAEKQPVEAEPTGQITTEPVNEAPSVESAGTEAPEGQPPDDDAPAGEEKETASDTSPEKDTEPVNAEVPDEQPGENELPITPPEGYKPVDPADLSAAGAENGAQLSMLEFWDIVKYAYTGENYPNALYYAGSGFTLEQHFNSSDIAASTVQMTVSVDSILYNETEVQVYYAAPTPQSSAAENTVLSYDDNLIPGGRTAELQTGYNGAGEYFQVGLGDGTYQAFGINSHGIVLDGVTYVAYCVLPYFRGPDAENGDEADPDFGDSGRIKTGIQAILDHGYPTVDGGRGWERYCTAFAISKWLAIDESQTAVWLAFMIASAAGAAAIAVIMYRRRKES